MPRSPVFGAKKKITSVSMANGMYEFFRRYSGRELNASGGLSLAILTVVSKSEGARFLMAQAIAKAKAAGDVAPDDLEVMSQGWDSNEAARQDAKLLRETGLAYDAELRANDDDEEPLPRPVGAPPLYEQPSKKFAVTLTLAETLFLDSIGTGKRPRSQGVRIMFGWLLKVDPDAAAMLCEIWSEGSAFVPQLFVDIANCQQ